MEVEKQGADALRAALRLAQDITGLVDLFQAGRLSKANAEATTAQMTADLAIVTAFVDRAASVPYFKRD